MTDPVPVSGEDQPDPRVEAAAQALFEQFGSNIGANSPGLGHRLRARQIIAAIDTDPRLTEDSHRVSSELYAAVARLSDGDELRADELADLLVRAAETLGRHRA